MRLGGKVALVTGAGRGIGRAIALALAEEGADLCVHYHRSEEGAGQVLKEIEAMGRNAVKVQADLARSDEVQALVDRAYQAFGRVEMLVNNAGIYERIPFRDLTEADWDRVFNVNLKGVFLCSHAVGTRMVEQGSGRIINIASIGGLKAFPDSTPYCVSKAGLIMLTQCLALALAPQVQVNAIAPGAIGTPRGFSERGQEAIRKRTPLKRFGKPEEVAEAVVFLATCNDFITGQVLFVDGGLSLR